MHLPIRYRCISCARGTGKPSHFVSHNTQVRLLRLQHYSSTDPPSRFPIEGSVNYNSMSIIRLSRLGRVRNEFGRIRHKRSSDRLIVFDHLGTFIGIIVEGINISRGLSVGFLSSIIFSNLD